MSLRILAFESSAKAAGTALLEDGSLRAEAYQNSGMTHSCTLMQMAEAMLRTAGLAVQDIDAAAVAAGPGSLTGVRIGAAAAQLVQTGETIFLASGTTTRAVLPGLSEVDFLNLVTNDLQIAMDAAEMENIALTMTGGSVRPGYYALRGVLAEDSMRAMKTGTAFVSCDAIDIQTGCYIANADEVRLLRQVVESTSYLVLLADHSKFFSGSFLSFCPIERVDLIISDTGLPAELCDEIRKKNIKLILA